MPKSAKVKRNVIKSDDIPTNYKNRMRWLQDTYRYRPDICAKHHFRININCPKSLEATRCKKSTDYMESDHRCEPNPRFSIVNLSIVSDLPGKDSRHANAVIIDHQRKEYERFEPNGALQEVRELIVNDVLGKEFKSYFNLNGYTYISPSSFCPLVSQIEDGVTKKSKKADKTYGPQSRLKYAETRETSTCIFWSLYYIQERMLRPEMSREDFMKEMSRKTPDDLRRIIQNFIVKVNYLGYDIKKEKYNKILGLT